VIVVLDMFLSRIDFMIDIKKLRELVKLMVNNELTELDIESEGERVSLKRRGEEPPAAVLAPAVSPAVSPPGVVVASPVGVEAQGSGAEVSDGLHTITSPMVGTFYSAASPDSPPFVQIGDRVSVESVVCLIEAMKVFNEIKAECEGVVVQVLVESGQAVEFDQPLFKVKPG